MKYQIWVEGYAATGQNANALFLGETEAESFNDACIKIAGDKLDKDSSTASGYQENKKGKFSIWSCGLYDNEADARKCFG